jgi:hypothetical protein
MWRLSGRPENMKAIGGYHHATAGGWPAKAMWRKWRKAAAHENSIS